MSKERTTTASIHQPDGTMLSEIHLPVLMPLAQREQSLLGMASALAVNGGGELSITRAEDWNVDPTGFPVPRIEVTKGDRHSSTMSFALVTGNETLDTDRTVVASGRIEAHRRGLPDDSQSADLWVTTERTASYDTRDLDTYPATHRETEFTTAYKLSDEEILAKALPARLQQVLPVLLSGAAPEGVAPGMPVFLTGEQSSDPYAHGHVHDVWPPQEIVWQS